MPGPMCCTTACMLTYAPLFPCSYLASSATSTRYHVRLCPERQHSQLIGKMWGGLRILALFLGTQSAVGQVSPASMLHRLAIKAAGAVRFYFMMEWLGHRNTHFCAENGRLQRLVQAMPMPACSYRNIKYRTRQ